MRILFLFIGEPHQVFHAAPIAAEMKALNPALDIEVAIATEAHRRAVEQVFAVYSGPPIPVRLLRTPMPFRQSRFFKLLTHIPYLRGFTAIVVPERSTTAIQPFLKRGSSLIFTPHGAGDRAILLDPRDRYFDFLLVAGEKSERRLLDAKLARPGAYAVNGYVKMDFMGRVATRRAPLFDNGRPTVLYTPHFRHSLSSWKRFGRAVIAAFAAQDDYNLVVAPHIRMFHGAPARLKAPIEALAIPGKIIVDLDSERLIDMSYTSGADIYLGDVSSQVYEFLGLPRPCVFLDAHGVEWRDNPDYRFWTLGEVVSEAADILPAIDRAPCRHSEFVDLQRIALADSIGGNPDGAARRGAEAIIDFLGRR